MIVMNAARATNYNSIRLFRTRHLGASRTYAFNLLMSRAGDVTPESSCRHLNRLPATFTYNCAG